MIQGLAAVGRPDASNTLLDGLANIAGPAIQPSNTTVEASFASAVAAAAGRAVETLQGAEALSLKALQGDVDTREVVDAVMSAEQTLQAGIAIRDKIVSAYLEMSRMAI